MTTLVQPDLFGNLPTMTTPAEPTEPTEPRTPAEPEPVPDDGEEE